MTRILIPGSFDPPTNGHLHLIDRARILFSEVCVLISINHSKQMFFNQQERMHMLTEMVSQFQNVKIDVWNGLVSNYAQKHNYQALLRGVRNTSDLSYELDTSNINYSLNHSVETLFLPTRLATSIIRSSYVRELCLLGTVIEDFVPPIVAHYLNEKIKHQTISVD